jgi:hypothetical protein
MMARYTEVHMLIRLILGLILGLSIFSCNTKTPEALIGQVVSMVNDEVVYKATVTVMQGNKVVAKTLTDENGFFSLKNLPSGTYDVIAEKKGFGLMKIESMMLRKGNEVITHFMLIPIS